MAEGEDRTLAASEKRLAQARAEGQAPLSREVAAAAGLGAAALLLMMGGPGLLAGLGGRLRGMLVAAGQGDAPGDALERAGAALLAGAGPVLGLVLLVGAAAVMLQTGFLMHGGAVVPQLGRLDPRRGLRRVFGRQNGVEALKAMAKLGVLGWALWRASDGLMEQARGAMAVDVGGLVDRLGREVLHLVLLVLATQAGIALLDVAWVRWRFAQGLRMGREEQRQEQRETEGDPRVKGRLKQMRLARAKRRMLAAVPKATVVVTNPTHYAVALAYERGRAGAPRVVAKGVDEVAARIREAATGAGVPLVANPPLARALYTVALDGEVPAEHFRAVAEIIAYVWRLRGLAGRR